MTQADPLLAPGSEQYVWIRGHPKSGTTWLSALTQAMLNAHCRRRVPACAYSPGAHQGMHGLNTVGAV